MSTVPHITHKRPLPQVITTLKTVYAGRLPSTDCSWVPTRKRGHCNKPAPQAKHCVRLESACEKNICKKTVCNSVASLSLLGPSMEGKKDKTYEQDNWMQKRRLYKKCAHAQHQQLTLECCPQQAIGPVIVTIPNLNPLSPANSLAPHRAQPRIGKNCPSKMTTVLRVLAPKLWTDAAFVPSHSSSEWAGQDCPYEQQTGVWEWNCRYRCYRLPT